MAITMKAARVNANMTQPDAAKALNISKNTLSNYEQGKSIPKFDVAKKMADLYGLTVNDIIFLPTDCA
jgi:DNA-binding XRE family transcriptional regulator